MEFAILIARGALNRSTRSTMSKCGLFQANCEINLRASLK